MKKIVLLIIFMVCVGCNITSPKMNSYDEKMLVALNRKLKIHENTYISFMNDSLFLCSVLRLTDTTWFIQGVAKECPSHGVSSGFTIDGVDSYFYEIGVFGSCDYEFACTILEQPPIQIVLQNLEHLYAKFDLDETYQIHQIYYPYCYSLTPSDKGVIRIELENKFDLKKFIYKDGEFYPGNYIHYSYRGPWNSTDPRDNLSTYLDFWNEPPAYKSEDDSQ